MTQPLIILIIALILTLVSATMNISGYITLYSHSHIIVAIIFSSLELAKASIFGIALVHRHITKYQKTLLFSFASLLLIISFLGHLSFLSRAYNINKTALDNSKIISQSLTDSYNQQLTAIDNQIQTLTESNQTLKDELETINNNIARYTTPNSSNWIYRQNKDRIQTLTTSIQDNNKSIQSLYQQKQQLIQQNLSNQQSITTHNTNIASRSSFEYTASIFNISQDKLASIINIVLSLAIDPMALLLLWTGTTIIERRRQEAEANKPKTNIEQPAQEHSILSNLTQKPKQQTISLPEINDIPDIDVTNAHKFSYNGYTLEDILRLDTATINSIKFTMKTKHAKDWLDACISIRNNRSLYRHSNIDKQDDVTELE